MLFSDNKEKSGCKIYSFIVYLLIMSSNNNTGANTERRYYQPAPIQNEWVSRNDTVNHYTHDLGNHTIGINNYFDDESNTEMNQTISAVSKPVINFHGQQLNGFTNFQPGQSIPDFRIKSKPGSRQRKK